MTTNNKTEEWKEEFDKEFVEGPFYDAAIWVGTPRNGYRITRRERIKKFISTLLLSEKKNNLQEIYKILSKKDFTLLDKSKDFRQAAIAIINSDMAKIRSYAKDHGVEFIQSSQKE